MRTYLLTWNPSKFIWDGFDEAWHAIEAGYVVDHWWTCHSTKHIRNGDRLFLMRLGLKPKGIIASGRVVDGPQMRARWDSQPGDPLSSAICFRIEKLLRPDMTPLFDPHSIAEDFSWYPQSSGINIPPPIADLLEKSWENHLFEVKWELTQHQIEPSGLTTKTYTEGRRKQRHTNYYERNPQAREDCVNHFGFNCVVCGFDFEAVYGEIGKQFIHVHHLKQLSTSDEPYELDPTKDLRPVCPNCHAMLHTQNPPLSIGELQNLIENA